MRDLVWLQSILKITGSFQEISEQSKLVEKIVHAAKELLHADRVSLFLREGKELVSYVATGVKSRSIRLDTEKGVIGFVYKNRKHLIINDTSNDPRFYREVDSQTGYDTKNLLALPLLDAAGEVIGVLELLNSRQGSFSDHDLQTAELFGFFVSQALKQSLRSDSLKKHTEKYFASVTHNTAGFYFSSKHPKLQSFYARVSDYAQSDSPVLFEGEIGSGRRSLARYLHNLSQRASGLFVEINCQTLSEAALEEEFFGTAKLEDPSQALRCGKLELANGGTLFLDEIAELPLSLQTKLLRAWEDKVIYRLGGESHPVQVNFRLVCSTSTKLESKVQNKSFRADLFYKIGVIHVEVPALRERMDDLVDLCTAMIKQLPKQRAYFRSKVLSSEALRSLERQSWPGNLFELQGKIAQACIHSGNTAELRPEHFATASSHTPAPSNVIPLRGANGQAAESSLNLSLKVARDEFERQFIERVLEMTKGNKTQAAKLLGLSREGLRKALGKQNSTGASKKIAA